jgi:hypothetical protein
MAGKPKTQPVKVDLKALVAKHKASLDYLKGK